MSRIIQIFMLIVLCGLIASAQSIKKPWTNAAEVSVVACTGLDIASSVGGYELNPVLGRGTFGWRQTGIKVGITGIWLLATHRHRVNKFVKTANWVFGGTTCGVAVHNFAIK